MAVVDPGLPPAEAIRFFESKGYQVSFDWRDLWQQEHAHAFTAAKSAGFDILSDLYAAADAALKDGTTLHEFQRRLTPILQHKGWWGRKQVTDPLTGETVEAQLGSPHRLRIIFDTNLRMAYATGRWQRIQRAKQRLPFLRYSAVQDNRTRPHHAAWHGLILPVDHPFWNTHFPPNGWNCRCRVVSLSERQLKRRGWQVSPDPNVQMRDWLNKRSGRTLQIPAGIDPGFAYNPGIAGRRWAEPPQPPPDPNRIPELAQADALRDTIGGQQGSNRGGTYRGADGKVRYVKFYQDPAQVYSEAVANRIYRKLGLEAPDSSIIRLDNGKIAIGNEIVDNRGTLTRTPQGRSRNLTVRRANKVLDGFAADVWTANWDALGADLDNIVVTDIRANSLARIDQGGALLFRAQGARKPPTALNTVSEWEKFHSPANPAYQKLFDTARIPGGDALGRRALTQIKKIQNLGKTTNDFADLVPHADGVPDNDRHAVLDMLRARARQLNPIAARIRAELNIPAHQRAFKQSLASDFANALNTARLAANKAPLHRMSATELVAVNRYSREHYAALNRPLRNEQRLAHTRAKLEAKAARLRRQHRSDAATQIKIAEIDGEIERNKKELENQRPFALTLNDALAKLPDFRYESKPNAPFAKVKRGASAHSYRWSDENGNLLRDKDAVRAMYRKGQTVTEAAFTSSSRPLPNSKYPSFGGDVQFTIRSKHGKSIELYSSFRRENEVLFSAGTRFQVNRFIEQDGKIEIEMKEVESSGMATNRVSAAPNLSAEDRAYLDQQRARGAQLAPNLTSEDVAFLRECDEDKRQEAEDIANGTAVWASKHLEDKMQSSAPGPIPGLDEILEV